MIAQNISAKSLAFIVFFFFRIGYLSGFFFNLKNGYNKSLINNTYTKYVNNFTNLFYSCYLLQHVRWSKRLLQLPTPPDRGTSRLLVPSLDRYPDSVSVPGNQLIKIQKVIE